MISIIRQLLPTGPGRWRWSASSDPLGAPVHSPGSGDGGRLGRADARAVHCHQSGQLGTYQQLGRYGQPGTYGKLGIS